jgi:hypothetical protein
MDVILNGGEAGVRDRRWADEPMKLVGKMASIAPGDCSGGAHLRTVPRRAFRPPQDANIARDEIEGQNVQEGIPVLPVVISLW